MPFNITTDIAHIPNRQQGTHPSVPCCHHTDTRQMMIDSTAKVYAQ
ncbi:MAG: hypothetical protein KDD67_15835 [Ignavibacteriae bacterium]|nr:hypothetical protein [Ignavibacteriota bacterium]MCB9215707.1 hypothetical protein [Ignavibacteria bacterium]